MHEVDPFLEAAQAKSRTEALRDRVYEWRENASNPLTRLVTNSLASIMDRRVNSVHNAIEDSMEHVGLIEQIKAADPMHNGREYGSPPSSPFRE